MATLSPDRVKPSRDSIDPDGYLEDRLLVRFKTAVLKDALPSAAASMSDHLGVLAAAEEHLGSVSRRYDVPLDRDPDADYETTLTQLERSGLLEAATPVRRPFPGETTFSAHLPLGTGTLSAAIAEAFAGERARPSDDVLAGSVLLNATKGQSEELRQALLGRSEVASVEKVAGRWLQAPAAPGSTIPVQPWHLERIKLFSARARAGFADASEISVGVLDTGVDQDHALLKSAIDSYSFQPPFPDVTSGSRDKVAHGTHVAGTIGAHGTAGDIEGVCRARLQIQKIFDDDVDGIDPFAFPNGDIVVFDKYLVAPVMYLRRLAACVDNNYEVVNLSIGGWAPGESREQQLFSQLNQQGQVVVAAMGNDRQRGSPTSWPAKYEGVVAVGALDVNDVVANFSSQGDHIWVTAPGVDILATMPTYKGVEKWSGKRDAAGNVLRDKPFNWSTYRGTMSGTSMAAPQVAGAAALWTARHGRDAGGFRTALKSSARAVAKMGSAAFTPDYGYGCLDIEKLLT